FSEMLASRTKGARRRLRFLTSNFVFYRLDELLPMLRRDADLSPSLLRRKKYINTGLLVLDEVGFEPMSRQDASLFFRVVSHRYQKGAILITTNKGIEA